jgi:hypothetical protein
MQAYPSQHSIPLQTLRTLTLHAPTRAGRPAFISAASGLAVHGSHFYVVADDELQLAVFADDMRQPGTTLPLLAGELPHDAKARKREKPDFETLAWLPPAAAQPEGSLLALGSGSRANRRLGVHLVFGAAPTVFDCSALYAVLEREFGIVNIEGIAVRRDRLLLLQRGNKTDGVNALIELDLASFRSGIVCGAIDGAALIEVRRCELGAIDGVALGFTDAICLPDDRLLALAVAEDTDDPYADGATLGSYLCRFDRDDHLEALLALDAPAKTEGLAAWRDRSGQVQLLFATDADDPAIPSLLLAAPIVKFI